MKRYRLSIAYGILMLFVVVGMVRLEMLAYRLEQEGITRAILLCNQNNELKGVMLQIIEQSFDPDHTSDFSPEIREYFESTQPEREEFRRNVRELLKPVECPPGPGKTTE